MVSVLVSVAVRAHFSIKVLEGRLAEIEAEKEFSQSAESVREFIEKMRGARSEVEGALSLLLERSRIFSGKYELADMREFFEDQKRLLEDVQKYGASRTAGQELQFFQRIIEQNFQEGDRERLRRIIERQLQDMSSLVELDTVGTMQAKQGLRQQLRDHVQGLLRIYHLLWLVDRTIPG